MAQNIINYGAAVNDGTGDPLRTAFIKTDDNFDQLWAVGPVGSNITVVNNTVGVTNTNGNLTLSPNGVGVIKSNGHVVPAANKTFDLGSPSFQFNAIYAGNVTGNTNGYTIGYREIPQIVVTGNVTVAAADSSKHFYSTLSSDTVLTVPSNSTVNWVVGTTITVVNLGTGNVTVARAAGVDMYLAGNSSSADRVVTSYGLVKLLNVAANTWVIDGSGVT